MLASERLFFTNGLRARTPSHRAPKGYTLHAQKDSQKSPEQGPKRLMCPHGACHEAHMTAVAVINIKEKTYKVSKYVQLSTIAIRKGKKNTEFVMAVSATSLMNVAMCVVHDEV